MTADTTACEPTGSDEELARAEVARKAGRLYEADGIARDVLVRSPGLAHAIAVRAQVAVDFGELDRAVELLEEATARRPEASWLMLLCNLHRRRFRLHEALRAISIAVANTSGPAGSHR